MGFKDVKNKVIGCLNNGYVLHAVRNDVDVKNLLSTGAVSIADTVKILKSSRGDLYETSPHHLYSGIDVHIVTTHALGKEWYVKWYFIEPDCVFISVHN